MWRINVLCCRGSTLYIILLVLFVGSGRRRVIVFCMKSDYLLSKEEKDNWEWLLWKRTENLCRRQIFLSASGKTGFIKSVKLLAWHFLFNWGVWVFNICSVESQRSLHVGRLWTSKHTLTSPVVQGWLKGAHRIHLEIVLKIDVWGGWFILNLEALNLGKLPQPGWSVGTATVGDLKLHHAILTCWRVWKQDDHP